jgi:hypothetical protein
MLAVPAYAGTVRVEVVPELGGLGAAPSATAAPGAAPLQMEANALIPAVSFAAPALAAMPVALAALPPAAAKPLQAEGRPLLIKALAAPALDMSKLGAGDSAGAAEKDFNARAQLDAPAANADGAPAAPAAGEASLKPRSALVRSAKPPVRTLSPRPSPGGALELVATPESLRAIVARGESRLLIRASDGRWLLSPRTDGGAYPTPEEIADSAGRSGRFFVASKAGLVEWSPVVPENVAAALRSGVSRLASRVPGLYASVLSYNGVALRRTSWRQAVEQGLDAGEAPLNEGVVIAKVIPALVAREFAVIAAKLGRSVDAEYKADVLKRTNGYRMYWHSAYSYKDHPDHVGIPDGHFRSDFGIRLMVKPDWRRIPDLAANYRPLFAHEYVHWLQNERFVSTKFGAEIAAVAVEVLRAIELVGLDEVRAGRAGTVHAGIMSSFEGGREWAREGFKNETAPYMKGVLAGAAYEAAQVTGRPEAAWEFLNLVVAGLGALEPAAAWARVVGAK